MGQICGCFYRDLYKENPSYKYKQLQLIALPGLTTQQNSNSCIHPIEFYEIHSELTLDSEM